jgi:predicted SAM-dependent methyltransferase
MIFSSHVLEHLTYLEAGRLFKEIYRVLEPGGCVRIVVPDLDLYISRFLAQDTEFFHDPEIAGGEWLGNITDSFLMNFYSSPVFNNTCHKYAYDFENLSCRLKQSGFKEIRKSNYMTSGIAEFNDKVFDSSNSKLPVFSLYCEAIK